ncbi:MAG: RNA methyltransferase [Candidatus Cloacimonetes bacterium]|nr:RNA methyltransferase [Candidatus Cloacimonadota bacterium]
MTNRTIFGRNPILEAIKSETQKVEKIFFLDGLDKEGRRILQMIRDKDIYHEKLDKHEIFNKCQSKQHQGFVAVTAPIRNSSLNRIYENKKQGLRVVMVPQIQDPQNLGALIRHCEHFAIDLLVVGTKGSCDIQLGSVAKTSAGAIEHMPVLSSSRIEKVLDELKEKEFLIYGLEGKSEKSLLDITPNDNHNLCLVLGSEGFGLKESTLNHIDSVVSIPRQGKVNSLNISGAALTGVLWLKGWLKSN